VRLLRRDGAQKETAAWRGPYAPYDLIKELVIALGAITLLTILLTILFSSPDDKPSTIAQWSRQTPVNFLDTATKELDGTSPTAEYGPPYNHNGKGQHIAFIRLQKWLGVSHPINTADDYVLNPLKMITGLPALSSALAQYRAAGETEQKAWAQAYDKPLEQFATAEEEKKTPPSSVKVDEATGTVSVQVGGSAGPVPVMMAGLLALAQSGGLDGNLLTSRQFYQTDYTKPLLLMADGSVLASRAEEQHLLGDQWGIMNETGSYPGQAWLWLYTLWYQVEPFKASANADVLVLLVMAVLSIGLICIPFIPGIRDLPRAIPIHRLIWREHYRSLQASARPGTSPRTP
jgi:hypothetical protein